MEYLRDIKIPDLQRTAAERVYSAFVDNAALAALDAKTNEEYLEYLEAFCGDMGQKFVYAGVSFRTAAAVIAVKILGNGMKADIHGAINKHSQVNVANSPT